MAIELRIVSVILDAKQKHLGCKKVRGQSEAACKQADATKSFDISLGQEVTLSKIILTPRMTYNSL